MRSANLAFPDLKSFSLALSLAAASGAASAQYGQPYNGQIQPYNSQDPQNYGAPAAQAYGTQGAVYQQQPAYDHDAYAQGGSYDQPYGQEQVYQSPPAIPDYAQPEAPGDGYIWTPGYWAWGRGGYYWVPGLWVLPPYQDALWTPGYWGYGYGGGGYCWNPGYWGLAVGYYGGINYGFGYFGTGFYGGYWRNHNFFYNREYAHLGFRTRNFYSERVGWGNGGHPGGQSFTTHVIANDRFRGGSYNQPGGQFRGDDRGGQRGQEHGFYSAGGQVRGGFSNGAQPGNPQSGLRQSPVQQRGQEFGNRPQYGNAGNQAINGGYRGQQQMQAPVQQQTLSGRPVYGANNGASGGFGNNGSRGQQQMQPNQQYRPSQPTPQGGGGFSRPLGPQSAPQNFHQSAPQQRFSAPSSSGFGGGMRAGGGGFAGGGGSRGGGHR